MEKDKQRLRVLITGTSSGIGLAIAMKFLKEGHYVIGFDIKPSVIEDPNYEHWTLDVGKNILPRLDNINIIINNAGTVDENDSIETNLIGYIRVAEEYAFQKEIKSVLNIASISAHTGIDWPYYSASQGGRISYTKNLAIRLGKEYKATVNSLSPGAVLTGLEPELYADAKLIKAVEDESILKKWIMPEEMADFAYFLTVINKSMTGQDVLVDNGESSNFNFIHV
jgi:3-oxoacyl-[acyl-carrier protein] reductase